MDLLVCLDCLNSCIWGNLVSIILTTLGCIGGTCSTLGALTGAVGYSLLGAWSGGMNIPYLGRFVTTLGALLGALLACVFATPCSLLGGGCSTLCSLIGWLSPIAGTGRIFATIGAFLGGTFATLAGSTIEALFSLPKSLIHNLIWICGGPITISAAYVENCPTEFLDACLDLIRHCLGG
ncbi:MAG: hypothetical protein MOIL_01337 [Candidatus Methanolliviera sp. GoM_oil]|nr:MAG: hypothetical protein MOIL_01337 [Candidatus Methanolliviera sp. GoM_oil]